MATYGRTQLKEGYEVVPSFEVDYRRRQGTFSVVSAVSQSYAAHQKVKALELYVQRDKNRLTSQENKMRLMYEDADKVRQHALNTQKLRNEDVANKRECELMKLQMVLDAQPAARASYYENEEKVRAESRLQVARW
jgi:hypothetical protein